MAPGVCRYLDAEQDGVCVSCGADRPTASAGPERADLIRMKTATGSAIIPSAGPARDRARGVPRRTLPVTEEHGMRSEQEVNRAIEQYSDTVRRLCMIHLKNDADTEDIFQTVFLKYVLSSVRFESQAHEKAWFIRVTVNACRDLLRSFFRSRTTSLHELMEQPAELPPDPPGGAGSCAGASAQVPGCGVSTLL